MKQDDTNFTNSPARQKLAGLSLKTPESAKRKRGEEENGTDDITISSFPDIASEEQNKKKVTSTSSAITVENNLMTSSNNIVSSNSYSSSSVLTTKAPITHDDVDEQFKKKKKAITTILSSARSGQDMAEEGFAISSEAFEDIAKALEEYSFHNKFKTVKYNKTNKTIDIIEKEGDRARDIEDDKSVGVRIVALSNKIKDHAINAIEKEDTAALIALGTLHHELTTLPSDLCNQENAKTFARLLQKYSPIKSPTNNSNSINQEDGNSAKTLKKNKGIRR